MEETLRTIAPIAFAAAILLFALPALVAACKQRGIGRGLLVFALLGLFTLAVEAVAVKTGVIYGSFQYGDAVGYRVLGTAPWLIAFAVPPLLFGAFWLVDRFENTFVRLIGGSAFMMASYATIAPALTRMSLWRFEAEGIFFGVPLQPLIAWFVVSMLGLYLLIKLWGDELAKRSIAYSSFAIVWFWSGVNLGLEQWVAASIGLASALVLLAFMWKEKRSQA